MTAFKCALKDIERADEIHMCRANRILLTGRGEQRSHVHDQIGIS